MQEVVMSPSRAGSGSLEPENFSSNSSLASSYVEFFYFLQLLFKVGNSVLPEWEIQEIFY
jgi:hypothetical protein